MDLLQGFATGVLGWRPKDFFKASPKTLRNAIDVHVKMQNHKDHLLLIQNKRLVISFAEIMLGEPSRINDYYNTDPPPPPIDDKLEAMAAHFKEKL